MTIEVRDKEKNILSNLVILNYYLRQKRGNILAAGLTRMIAELKAKNKLNDIYNFSVKF